MKKTVQKLAAEYSSMFVRDTRNDGTEFVKTIDGRPEELTQLIHAAHNNMMPDDWKYKFVEASLDLIAETEDEEDLDSPNIEPDVYNSTLLQWLSSNLTRAEYFDEAVEEYGWNKEGFYWNLMAAQVREKEEVYFSVLSSLREIIEDMEDELYR
jgi:hypothetical protein